MHKLQEKTAFDTFEVVINKKVYVQYYEVMELNKLDLSPNRQRDFDEKWCKKIEKNFNPNLVTIVAVEHPNGDRFLIAGQHCSRAAKNLGYTHWIVRIICTSGDIAEEILLCDDFNRKTKRPTTVDKWSSLVLGKDVEALANVALLKQAGRDWAKCRHNWNIFVSLADTIWIQKKRGDDALIKELLFANMCWEKQNEVNEKFVVRGIDLFLNEWITTKGSFPLDNVIRVLKTTVLHDLKDKAGNSRFCGCNDPTGLPFAKALADTYNNHPDTKGLNKLYHNDPRQKN